jgi:ribosome-binding ATPase YchF (GTP1/OBG family)
VTDVGDGVVLVTCGLTVRAWTVKKGATAPQAAGVIHSDFERSVTATGTGGQGLAGA